MKITDRQKKQLLISLVIFAILFICLRIVSSLMDSGKEQEDGNIDIEMIPDPEENDVETSKIEAYSNVERMWDEYESADREEDLYAGSNTSLQSGDADAGLQADEEVTESGNKRKGPVSGNSKVEGQRSSPVPGDKGYREYRMREYYQSAGTAVEKGEAEKDSILKADKVSAQNSAAEVISIGEHVTVRPSSAISTLDGSSPFSDDGGFSTLSSQTDDSAAKEGYPIECMFVRNEKLHNGSRVSIRLLEDMVLDGVLIPKNTHLMAMCAIRERLELTVSSIERNSRIYSLNYEAYDSDGGKGIYCPFLNEQEVQTVKDQGLSSIRSFFGGRLGSLASTAVNTGISIAQNKNGEVTVNVPSGYRFYIVKSKRQ